MLANDHISKLMPIWFIVGHRNKIYHLFSNVKLIFFIIHFGHRFILFCNFFRLQNSSFIYHNNLKSLGMGSNTSILRITLLSIILLSGIGFAYAINGVEVTINSPTNGANFLTGTTSVPIIINFTRVANANGTTQTYC